MGKSLILLALATGLHAQILPGILNPQPAAGSSFTLVSALWIQLDGTASSAITVPSPGAIFINGTCYTASTSPPTPTDSKSNSYTSLTYYGNGVSGTNGQLFYNLSPASGSTTFSANGSPNCSSGRMFVSVWSGTFHGFVSATDVGAYCSGGTVSPSSITVTAGNLIIAGTAFYTPTGASLGSWGTIVFDSSATDTSYEDGSIGHAIASGSTFSDTVTGGTCSTGLMAGYYAAFH